MMADAVIPNTCVTLVLPRVFLNTFSSVFVFLTILCVLVSFFFFCVYLYRVAPKRICIYINVFFSLRFILRTNKRRKGSRREGCGNSVARRRKVLHRVRSCFVTERNIFHARASQFLLHTHSFLDIMAKFRL